MNKGGLIFLHFKSGSHGWSMGAWVSYWWVYEGFIDRMHIEYQYYTVLLIYFKGVVNLYLFSVLKSE
jgi:hypothetical protein